MAGKSATLALKITGDASGGLKALDDAESRAGRFGSTMGKMGGAVLGGALIAGGALVGLGAGLKSLYDAADESRKIGALTTQVIKSTGSAAGVTAQQVGDLAGAIAAKTGVDDEAIQSGENLLLTFTNVKNGVGAGNDIFNQATKTMVDMSAALGTDASGSAIQLGKALNDPVKGISALQKVGVSFTATQKDQIAALVKAGDTMGAQKIILGELNKEFGGAAEAASTPLDRLKQRLGDVAEGLGAGLLPLVDKGAAFLGDKLMPAVSSLADKLGPVLLPIVQQVGGFLTGSLIPAVMGLWNELGPKLGTAVQQVGGFLVGTLIPAIVGLWTELGPKLLPIVKDVGNFITGFLVPAFLMVGDYLTNYIIPIFKAILGPAIEGIGHAFHSVTSKIMEHKDTFLGLYESMKPFLGFIRDQVAPVIGGVFKVAFEIAGKAIGAVVDLIAGIIDKIKWILDKGAAVGNFIGGLFGASSSAPGRGGARRAAPLRGAARGGALWSAGSIGGGGTSPSVAAGGLTPVGDTYNITVTGALDPVAVADQIGRLLDARARRVGAAPAFGVRVA